MAVPAVVEGYMESVFLPIILTQIGRTDLQPTIRDAGGGTKFWPIAKRYNEAGEHMAVIGLADLEQAPCASALIENQLTQKSNGFHLRLAVRMIESWLIADRTSLAKFLKVPISIIPTEPDAELHAKRKLVDIARRSTSRSIREAIVPGDSGGVVGPDYVATMCNYITTHWQAASARHASPSLDRACIRWLAI